MATLLKILIILGVLLFLAYPLFPLSKKVKRISTARALRYDYPHNRKNWIFMLLVIFEIAVFAVLASILGTIGGWLDSAPEFLKNLFSKIPSVVTFDAYVIISVIFVNLVALYTYVIFKGLIKKGILDSWFGIEARERERKRRKKRTRTKRRNGGRERRRMTSRLMTPSTRLTPTKRTTTYRPLITPRTKRRKRRLTRPTIRLMRSFAPQRVKRSRSCQSATAS